mmetsp:Transcript_47825/g.85379  ORF Transcript_47825/g.85379 Transcript_47825/m.85379 type:complete len:100 (+) Transcript_47825:554-853(+)
MQRELVESIQACIAGRQTLRVEPDMQYELVYLIPEVVQLRGAVCEMVAEQKKCFKSMIVKEIGCNQSPGGVSEILCTEIGKVPKGHPDQTRHQCLVLQT